MNNEPDNLNDHNGSAISWLVFCDGGALVGALLVTLLDPFLDGAS
jgi:hypothetical protein